MKKLLFLMLLVSCVIPSALDAQGVPVRLKDISKIIEARDNQLFGFGLVVGLRGTGDSRSSEFTETALTNLMKKMGVAPGSRPFSSRNVASVMVTAVLRPFTKPGQKLSVVVSSLGDASSLVGGTLLPTPLKGLDMMNYAVAQGSVVVGGVSQVAPQSTFLKNQSTVGRVVDGGIVETEVPVTFNDQHHITIVLDDTNFITIARVTEALKLSGYEGTRAIDANTIKVPFTDLSSKDLVSAIADLENVMVVPDESNKIVVNSRTGTIVIGEKVRLFPVAVTHGNISVRINEIAPGGLGGGGGGAQVAPEALAIEETQSKVVYLNPAASLSSLVNALNEIGVSPKDLISILQALKEAQALVADIQVL